MKPKIKKWFPLLDLSQKVTSRKSYLQMPFKLFTKVEKNGGENGGLVSLECNTAN